MPVRNEDRGAVKSRVLSLTSSILGNQIDLVPNESLSDLTAILRYLLRVQIELLWNPACQQHDGSVAKATHPGIGTPVSGETTSSL